MKTKKAANQNAGPATQRKTGRTQIRLEEPRRAAPRTTGRDTERGNQQRTRKHVKK